MLRSWVAVDSYALPRRLCSRRVLSTALVQQGDVAHDEAADLVCRGTGLINAIEKPLALDPPSEFESFLQQVGSALEVAVDPVSSHSRCGAALLVSRLL